jgi:hypothetical protein
MEERGPWHRGSADEALNSERRNPVLREKHCGGETDKSPTSEENRYLLH